MLLPQSTNIPVLLETRQQQSMAMAQMDKDISLAHFVDENSAFTSVKPQDERFRSRVCFSLDEIVEQRLCSGLVDRDITGILDEADGRLSRQARDHVGGARTQKDGHGRYG